MFSITWLRSLTVIEAQVLSQLSVGLFAVMLFFVVLGLLKNLSPRATHWLCLISFSSSLMLGVITSMLYFWHWYFRR